MLRPVRPPALVYLDLNHWINLAKVEAGKPSPPGYVDLLAAATTARSDRTASFVLTASLVRELWSITDPRQRRDLVAVIESLTDFQILAGPVDLMRVELLASVASLCGDDPPDVGAVPLVGTSLLHAFGMRGGLRIVDEEGQDRTSEQLEANPALSARWAEMNRTAERMLLQGPEDDAIDDLRARGYRPEVTQQQVIDNAAVEQVFAEQQLTDHWRRGRIRDLIAARELNLELNDALTAELLRRHTSLTGVAGSAARARALVLSMPTSCTRVELKTQYHRNARKRWTPNDINDIDALAVAVPYTDLVFTDAAARDAALRAHLDERMQTEFPRRPADLTDLLTRRTRTDPTPQ